MVDNAKYPVYIGIGIWKYLLCLEGNVRLRIEPACLGNHFRVVEDCRVEYAPHHLQTVVIRNSSVQ